MYTNFVNHYYKYFAYSLEIVYYKLNGILIIAEKNLHKIFALTGNRTHDPWITTYARYPLRYRSH